MVSFHSEQIWLAYDYSTGEYSPAGTASEQQQPGSYTQSQQQQQQQSATYTTEQQQWQGDLDPIPDMPPDEYDILVNPRNRPQHSHPHSTEVSRLSSSQGLAGIVGPDTRQGLGTMLDAVSAGRLASAAAGQLPAPNSDTLSMPAGVYGESRYGAAIHASSTLPYAPIAAEPAAWSGPTPYSQPESMPTSVSAPRGAEQSAGLAEQSAGRGGASEAGQEGGMAESSSIATMKPAVAKVRRRAVTIGAKPQLNPAAVAAAAHEKEVRVIVSWLDSPHHSDSELGVIEVRHHHFLSEY